MAKTSIFYYTNNIVPPKLFEHTFCEAVKHCRNNNCELIVTSHYPITEKYETHLLNDTCRNKGDIYNYIIQKPLVSEKDLEGIDAKIYVVGQLPYSCDSIVKQILFSIEHCTGENVILMEHDCLYPENYIPTVEKCLMGYGKDVTYCCFNNCYLNEMGYFNINVGNFVLSTFGFKKEILKGIYSRKMELRKEKKPCAFEPIFDTDLYKTKTYKDEIIVRNHLYIDTFLGDYKCPLDIKHHLNTDGFLIAKDYYHSHPYWGNDKQYIDMILSAKVDEKNQKLWNYGIGKLDY